MKWAFFGIFIAYLVSGGTNSVVQKNRPDFQLF